jgi:hypothetical protein
LKAQCLHFSGLEYVSAIKHHRSVQAIFNFVHVEVSKNGPFRGNNQGIGLV